MKKLISLTTALIMLFSLALSLSVPKKPILADAGPVYLYGVNITPYQENNVRLEKEALSIEFEGNKGPFEESVYVYAKFVFVNKGEKISLKMGFPFGISRNKGNVIFPKDVVVKIDGKTIETHSITSETSKYDPWIYFDVLFDKGEIKTVEVSYTATPLGGYFAYILNTGALWKGPIGTLDIEIKFPNEAKYPYLLSLKPQGYTIQGNKALYHFTNFEPTQDIEIEFLPEKFLAKIESLKEKAEKTNSAVGWFNYAISLFPQNPFGEYKSLREGGFVGGYVTDTFKNYVLSVIDKAKSLQKEESPEYKILDAIRIARTDNFTQFEAGLYVSIETKGIRWLPEFILNVFDTDVENPQNKLEGKIIAYLMEYKVFFDFEENLSIKALSSLDTFLSLADKYLDKDDYFETVPYIVLDTKEPKIVAPFFMECFIPKVSIDGSKVQISYILPLSMQSAVRDSSIDGLPNNLMKSHFEENYPYVFTIDLNFSSVKAPDEFDNVKKQILQYVREQIPTKDADVNEVTISFKLISIYLNDILNNLVMKDGRIVTVSSLVDCTSKIENAIKNLDNEVSTLKNYKNFQDTNIELMLIKPVLTLLDSNRSLFEYAIKNSKIEFETVSTNQEGGNDNTNNVNGSFRYIVIALSAFVILLLIALIVVILKINNMKNPS